MDKTPKGNRLHIVVVGQRNAGKSTLINQLSKKQISIVSHVPGTTTDPVDVAMEFPGLGPVVLTDTAGIDDTGELGQMRVEKSYAALEKADLILIIFRDNWSEWEEHFLQLAKKLHKPTVLLSNAPTNATKSDALALDVLKQDLEPLRELVRSRLQKEPKTLPIIADLLPPDATVLLVMPIDAAAPKGRLILPQVQTLREILDEHASALVCQTEEVPAMVRKFGSLIDLVVTDSQAFKEVDAALPPNFKLTSFSILFSRHKGGFDAMVRGARAIDQLREGDSVLIAEACTHHATDDDIGRVKIPRLLQNRTQKTLKFVHHAGPLTDELLSQTRLIVHCGACMWNSARLTARTVLAEDAGIPITNYGMAIAQCLGILERALSIFALKTEE